MAPISWLSPAMKLALDLLAVAAKEGHDPHGVSAATFSMPYLSSGQPWLHFGTAEALERRGLVRIVEGSDVYLIGASS